jgi:MoaA/NifB/PqqE/SkfB family radical SAM enzyme
VTRLNIEIRNYRERCRNAERAQVLAASAAEVCDVPPTEVILEPTNYCNLTCSICPTGAGTLRRPAETMKPELLESLLKQIGGELLTLSLWNYGEPLLSPHFPAFLKMAAATDAFCQTCTNGHHLTEDLCRSIVAAGTDQVIFSLDGLSQDSLRVYRGDGADFNKVQQAIKTLVAVRAAAGAAKPKIVLQMILMRHNEHERHRFREFASEIGADESYLKALIVDLADQAAARSLLPRDPADWVRYQDRDGVIVVRGDHPGFCRKLYTTLTVLADGKVVPCCYDARAEVVLGDLNHQTVAEIWNGEPLRALRRDFSNRSRRLDMCGLCPEGRVESLKIPE